MLPTQIELHSSTYTTTSMRPSQGFGGTGEQGHLFEGNRGTEGQNLRATGEQRQYWGTGNIENNFSIFGEQGNKPIYFRGTREQVPPLGGPHYCCGPSQCPWHVQAKSTDLI